MGGIYAVPAVHMESRGVFTNTTPVDAYRGAGKPEANYITERLSAADGGQVEAIYDLGLLYSTGQGVELDLVEAHKWFNLAAMKGLQRAAVDRSDLYRLFSRCFGMRTVVMTGDEERSGRPLDLARAALVQAADEADIAIAYFHSFICHGDQCHD